MIPIRYWRAALFSEHALHSLKMYARWRFVIVLFFLNVLLQSLPVTKEEIYTFPFDFLGILWNFALAVILVYFVSWIFKSKIHPKKFLYVLNVVMFGGILLTTVLAYSSLFIFELLLDTPVISNLVTSLLPFYLLVLFGFSADIISDLEGWRAVILGLFSTSLLFWLYFFL